MRSLPQINVGVAPKINAILEPKIWDAFETSQILIVRKGFLISFNFDINFIIINQTYFVWFFRIKIMCTWRFSIFKNSKIFRLLNCKKNYFNSEFEKFLTKFFLAEFELIFVLTPCGRKDEKCVDARRHWSCSCFVRLFQAFVLSKMCQQFCLQMVRWSWSPKCFWDIFGAPCEKKKNFSKYARMRNVLPIQIVNSSCTFVSTLFCTL